MGAAQDISSVKQLIEGVIPYKKEIIFFGSRAREGYGPDSDFDVLVVVHEKDVDRRELVRLQAKVKRLGAKVGLDIDVIVRDLPHAEEMKNFPGNIIHSAYQTGVHI
jgi:predicted nucleotidyltransferase